MTEIELQTFTENYSSQDFDKIKFDWNGQHAEKFRDNNFDYRMQLCEFLIPQINTVKLDLIRDLYIELSKWAKEAWCVYGKYHLLAQQLLVRGGTDYILDYLNGATQCFDTLLASGRVSLTKEQNQNLLDYINDNLKTTTDESQRNLLQVGKDRFEKALHVN